MSDNDETANEIVEQAIAAHGGLGLWESASEIGVRISSEENGERWRRLAVRFPEHVHTHSREQVLYVDANGLIRRHDYTAEPIGGLARAAHYCLDHRSFDGLTVPTRRRVYPRKRDNRRRIGPLLVWIEAPSATVQS